MLLSRWYRATSAAIAPVAGHASSNALELCLANGNRAQHAATRWTAAAVQECRGFCTNRNDDATKKQSDSENPKKEQQKTSDGPESSNSASDTGPESEQAGPRSSRGTAEAAKARLGEAQKMVSDAAKSTFSFTRAVYDEMTKSSGKPSEAGADKPGTDSARTDSQSSSSTRGGTAKGAQKSGTGFAQNVFNSVRQALGSAGRAGSSSGKASAGEDMGYGATLVQRLRKEVAEAVLPVGKLRSVMKRRDDVDAVEIQKKNETWVDKLKQRLGNNPLAQRIESIRASETASRIAEGYESIKERLEHSDSEVVNRVKDMRDGMMSENEQAVAYREIRMRHPNFDLPLFLKAIKTDVPTVIQAYLGGNEQTLKEFCSDAIVERLMGIYKVTQAQGHNTDPTILEYSDVDMVDMKIMDGDPVIILHFSCQQINCVRDQYGNVIDGAPDEVNRVYYYWAVQQDGHGMVTNDGDYIPPRWKLIEMLMRGMHQLL